MDHDKRVDKYFATRTNGQNGVLKDILWAPNNSHTIMVGDNDYLNLVHHREVLTKQAEDLMNCTVYRDTVKSALFLSDFDPHTALEQDVGAWYGKGCYFAQSGYAANVGVMHAVCTPGMHVYVDTFLHMSFYDGLASRRAKVHAFKTNDAADLEKKIANYGPGLIIVESVYSTSGAFAPLEDIVRVKKAHNCLLVVDESHSFGLFGTEGRGLLHVKGLVNDVDYVTVSLAKAYATRAGLVFTKHALYVKENSYPYIFSSGLVQNDIVRLRAIWEVIKAADDRRERLINVATFFRSEMNKVAKVVGGLKNTPCAIVGVLMKDEEQLASLHRFLSNKGILAAPFIAPATSPDFPILRFTVHCDISMKDAVVITQAVKEWTLQSKASAKAKL